MSRPRTCCDGQCLQGRACPLVGYERAAKDLPRPLRFVPGVIDGPHARPSWLRRLAARLWGGRT